MIDTHNKNGAPLSIKFYAENVAYHIMMGNSNDSIPGRFFENLERMASGFFGRIVQNYPGEFIEQVEYELSKYPGYYKKG